MTNNTVNIFAIVDDVDIPIRRIPLTNDLQTQIYQFFRNQKKLCYGQARN